MSTPYNFNVEIADAGGAVCVQPVTINVQSPFCMGNPSSIYDAAWTLSFTTGALCTYGSIVHGICNPWQIKITVGGGACDPGVNELKYLEWTTTLCNPSTAYTISVDIPTDGDGTAGGAHTATLQLFVNGVCPAGGQDGPVDIFTLPHTFHVAAAVPATSAAISLRIYFVLNAITGAPFNYVRLFPLGGANMTVTPLYHP